MADHDVAIQRQFQTIQQDIFAVFGLLDWVGNAIRDAARARHPASGLSIPPNRPSLDLDHQHTPIWMGDHKVSFAILRMLTENGPESPALSKAGMNGRSFRAGWLEGKHHSSLVLCSPQD